MNLDTLARVHAERALDTVTKAEPPPLDRNVRVHQMWSLAAGLGMTFVAVAALLVLPLAGPADPQQGANVSTPFAPPITPAADALVEGPLPDNTWLNFLAELCEGGTNAGPCFRDAHWMDPANVGLGTGVWTAYRPFHVREGFVSSGESLGADFDVVLTITRWEGPPLEAGVFPLGESFVDTTDFVSRGTTEYCGPGYATQEGTQECQWFVHDFPDGLPPGRYDIRADWQAPCSAWVDLGFVESCVDADEVMSLFESFVNAPFFDDLSIDPFERPEPVIFGGAAVDQTSEPFSRNNPGLGAGSAPSPALGREAHASSGARFLSDEGIAVDANTRLPLGERSELPYNAWLDFLAGLCGQTCFLDAHFIDPNDDQTGFGRWAAYLPFHIREGFLNEGEAPLGDAFDVVVYVTRRAGPPLADNAFVIDQTYRFASDYVMRGTASKCGPGFRDQTAAGTCEWFVHDFSAGLPPGRYDIWAKWYAPCAAWLELGLVTNCGDPNEAMSMFESSVNMPFIGEGFTEGEQLPFDPYLYPEPITRGAPTG